MGRQGPRQLDVPYLHAPYGDHNMFNEACQPGAFHSSPFLCNRPAREKVVQCFHIS